MRGAVQAGKLVGSSGLVPEHVEENVAAASLELSPDEIRAITKGA
jgi:aryl-alcohol dehydrogenase-like predicted oxidoreductase